MHPRLEAPLYLLGSYPRERALFGELQLIRKRLDDVLTDISRVLRQTEHEEAWEQVGQATRIALRAVRAAAAAVPVKEPEAAALPDLIEADELRVDTCTGRQWYAEEEFKLSVLQHELLALFASDPRRVFGRDELLRHVWGYLSIIDTASVDGAVYRLRSALVAAGAPKGEVLIGVRNVGWSLFRPWP